MEAREPSHLCFYKPSYLFSHILMHVTGAGRLRSLMIETGASPQKFENNSKSLARGMNSTVEFGKNPLNKIIGLSIVLSMGFLLVVLAGISGNWFPIVDGIIFAIAYLPVIISRVLFNSSDYDFSFDPQTSSRTSAVQELGKFLTAALLVTGFYLPVLLHHSHFLTTTAVVLTLLGGSMIYGTVYTFSQAFDNPEESEGDIGSGVI